MFAVIGNTIAILVGCSIGLLLRKGIPETMSDALMKGWDSVRSLLVFRGSSTVLVWGFIA